MGKFDYILTCTFIMKKKVSTVIVNNFTNINKMNNYLSLYLKLSNKMNTYLSLYLKLSNTKKTMGYILDKCQKIMGRIKIMTDTEHI